MASSVISESGKLRAELYHLSHKAAQVRLNWNRWDDVMGMRKMTWTPHVGVLLAGVRQDDGSSPLSLLAGQEETLVQAIYGYAFEFAWDNWKAMVTKEHGKDQVHNTLPSNLYYYDGDVKIPLDMYHHLNAVCDDKLMTRRGYHQIGPERIVRVIHNGQCAFTRCGTISFPPPTGVDINMMPFIMGDKTSLPERLQVYYDPLIASCPLKYKELGKVCYLSITERYIEKGQTQRRGGLHIEAPINVSNFIPGREIRSRWGRGSTSSGDSFEGGIFMASNVAHSCAIYDALVKQDTTDAHGGMEHLRPLLNNPYLIPANELIWMTDRTPHQAMPQPESGYRQFFRLVTSDFNVWHSQHCTANPKVPLPAHVHVIHESRFDDNDRKKAAVTKEDRKMGPATSAARNSEGVQKKGPHTTEVAPGMKQEAKNEAGKEEHKKRSSRWHRKEREACRAANAAKKEACVEIAPIDLFRLAEEYEGMYSEYDEDTGLPTHDAHGKKITKCASKKLAKEQAKHKKHCEQGQAKKN